MEHNDTPTFNPEQLSVIHASGGYHLVLAPPGCGKTAVLAERIAQAHGRGVAFSDMACLTFTNRASRGMKDRVGQVLSADAAPAPPAPAAVSPASAAVQTSAAASVAGGDEAERLFIGNVHRFCSLFLFENGLVPEDSAIIDTDVSISIIADYLGEDELRILGDAKQRQRYSAVINLQHLMYQCCQGYPGALMVHRDALPAATLRELCTAFGLPYTQQASIDLYLHADDYLTRGELLSAEAHRLLNNLYAARQYERYKRQNSLLDFEDLLLFTYDYFHAAAASQPSAAASQPSGGGSGVRPAPSGAPLLPQKRWIQVDEVQDLNPLQLAIIDQFTAPGATVVYLGDAQQAIFSFMGAKMDTLEQLRQRCGTGGLHNFYVNYRSPRYLLDLFNSYAQQLLGISADLLPQSQNTTPRQVGDLKLCGYYSNVEALSGVSRLVDDLCRAHPSETMAVVVAFNSDADEVSAALKQPHFKISGVDLFSTPDVRMLLAHLNVVHNEANFICWSRLFTGLRVYQSNSASRQFVHAMMENAVSPVDFLRYEGSTYVAEFVKDYAQCDFVVFDTETTGLDVFADDVVQIAAIRVRQGRVVDRLNLFIETQRPIPAMLGDVVNPLVSEYERQPHQSPDAAFAAFLHFAEGAILLGHNADYDWHIMTNNMLRRAPALSMPVKYYDSLKLIRLLKPHLQSYKLKNLLVELHLEGRNSHLADDDIMATLSLVAWCYRRAETVVGRQLEFVSRHRQTAERFRNLYRDLYDHSVGMLYRRIDDPLGVAEPPLVAELRYAYDYLRDLHRIGEVDKLHYIEDYVAVDLVVRGPAMSLVEQLNAHLQDLNTMKEADLCGSKSMQERVFVSTVHKAKGLEFDNVIVYDVVEGKYPSHYAATPAARSEEARKLYVAMSRARRRLLLTYTQQYVSPFGRVYPRQLSPFVQAIRAFFD